MSFDGSANINLPGVNTGGTENTSGNAATASTLENYAPIQSSSSTRYFPVLQSTGSSTSSPTSFHSSNHYFLEWLYNQVTPANSDWNIALNHGTFKVANIQVPNGGKIEGDRMILQKLRVEGDNTGSNVLELVQDNKNTFIHMESQFPSTPNMGIYGKLVDTSVTPNTQKTFYWLTADNNYVKVGSAQNEGAIQIPQSTANYSGRVYFATGIEVPSSKFCNLSSTSVTGYISASGSVAAKGTTSLYGTKLSYAGTTANTGTVSCSNEIGVDGKVRCIGTADSLTNYTAINTQSAGARYFPVLQSTGSGTTYPTAFHSNNSGYFEWVQPDTSASNNTLKVQNIECVKHTVLSATNSLLYVGNTFSQTQPSTGSFYFNWNNNPGSLGINEWNGTNASATANVSGTGWSGISLSVWARYSVLSGNGFALTSDARNKRRIQPLKSDESYKLINKLRPVTFLWKDTKKNRRDGLKSYGFIAQDLEKYVPEAVSSRPGILSFDRPILGKLSICDVSKIVTVEADEWPVGEYNIPGNGIEYEKIKIGEIIDAELELQEDGNAEQIKLKVIQVTGKFINATTTSDIDMQKYTGSIALLGREDKAVKDVEQTQLISLLVSALQASISKVETLETRIARLEALLVKG